MNTRNKFFLTSCIMLWLLSSTAFGLCINVEKARLRSGPGTSYSKTWIVYKYMPLREINKKGAWYHVYDVDGYEHWVLNKLITDKYYCAVVRGDDVNLHSGPGIKYPVLDKAKKYTSFKFISRNGPWIKISDLNNKTFWIHESFTWIN